jgi:hypothetical protein
MRKAHSAKMRPLLLADLERRYRHAILASWRVVEFLCSGLKMAPVTKPKDPSPGGAMNGEIQVRRLIEVFPFQSKKDSVKCGKFNQLVQADSDLIVLAPSLAQFAVHWSQSLVPGHRTLQSGWKTPVHSRNASAHDQTIGCKLSKTLRIPLSAPDRTFTHSAGEL